MAVKTKTDLKTFFENGDVPDAQAFIDLIDTFPAINSASLTTRVGVRILYFYN